MRRVDESTPEVRIGDRERGEVDARLQRAYADGVLTMTEYEERSAECWKARTRSELDPLTRDLPVEPEAKSEPPVMQKAVAEAPPSAPPAHQHASRRPVFKILAAVVLLGGVAWGGSRVLAADDGSVVFGHNDVVVAADDTNVEVGSLFGSLQVTVPADARVRIDGGMAFGSVHCVQACDGTGQRDVVVDASGAFGSINVVRPGEKISNNNRNDNDNDNDDDN
jgi:Domain of unknown function (DUF1707)